MSIPAYAILCDATGKVRPSILPCGNMPTASWWVQNLWQGPWDERTRFMDDERNYKIDMVPIVLTQIICLGGVRLWVRLGVRSCQWTTGLDHWTSPGNLVVLSTFFCG